MEQNKYVTIHSFLRYGAALIALIVFISMFFGKQIVHSEFDNTYFNWIEVFFGGTFSKPEVVGFIGYLFVLIGGLSGLAFVFIDEILGKDLIRILSFVAGGVIALGGVMILLIGVLFRAINEAPLAFHLAAAPIVFGILAIVAGAANAAVPFLEDKGL